MLDQQNIQSWLVTAPIFQGTLEQDTNKLASYVAKGQELLDQLPAKLKRDATEQSLADDIFSSCRLQRSQFIEQHVEAIYSKLTNHFSQYRRLSELVYEAALHFPGLVPTRASIETEHQLIQAHKEGLEIDQGIFFRGLLRSSKVGSHLADAMLLPCPRALQLIAEFRQSNKLNLGSILIERRGDAAHLTINNQHCLNAENQQLIDDMETAVDLVLLDERIKVGVLRGGVMTHPRYHGKKVFCAGINLTDLHAGKIAFVDFLLGREFGYISKIAHGLLIDNKFEQKPWIAAVDSFAIGGGMQLLLVFDKIIAADDAYFSLPAAQEGIVPGAANFRLSRITGNRLARQIILSGRKIFATDPEAGCLCDEVVPANEIDAAIEIAVQAFNNPAVVENRRMLVLAEEPRDRFRQYMAEFSYIQATRLYSPDVLAKISRWSRDRKSMKISKESLACV